MKKILYNSIYKSRSKIKKHHLGSIAFWNEVSVRVKSVLESAGFLSQTGMGKPPPDCPLCPVWALKCVHYLDLDITWKPHTKYSWIEKNERFIVHSKGVRWHYKHNAWNWPLFDHWSLIWCFPSAKNLILKFRYQKTYSDYITSQRSQIKFRNIFRNIFRKIGPDI